MITCEHCDAPVVFDREGRWLIKSATSIRNGVVETQCGKCKRLTRLPFRFEYKPSPAQTPTFLFKKDGRP